MLRKFLVFCFALTLSFPVLPVHAAPEGEQGAKVTASKSKKAKARAKAKVRAKAKARWKAKAKRTVSGRKIIHTIRSSSKYPIRPASHAQQASVFQDDTIGGELRLGSSKALILNQETGEVLYAKSTDLPTPIASVTKLMTAMVVLDAQQPMDEMVTVTSADVDTLKGTGSRLRVGTMLSRAEMLQLALMSSENRAASALGHAYPGGYSAFVQAMNAKALALGMNRSRFVDATGLNSANVSTAEDLAKMVKAAYEYQDIRQASTSTSSEVPVYGARHPLEFRNTNTLVRNSDWDIGLSKTGFINEAGRCLVMQARIAEQPLIIVLLDSWGKYTRIGDAQRIRKWIESSNEQRRLNPEPGSTPA
jgi:D-alanyl-D-alanine endopeptidase (penicillin-binding protein 7)